MGATSNTRMTSRSSASSGSPGCTSLHTLVLQVLVRPRSSAVDLIYDNVLVNEVGPEQGNFEVAVQKSKVIRPRKIPLREFPGEASAEVPNKGKANSSGLLELPKNGIV